MKKKSTQGFLNFQSILYLLALLTITSASHVVADEIRIGSTPSGHLMWIADAEGFFEAEGAQVKLLEFSSGVTASKALASDQIDLGNSSEFAFVGNVIRTPELRIIASIARTNSTTLFARADSGIRAAGDLVGRRIGVTKRSIGEFFLAEYLTLNGVWVDEVKMINLRAPDIVDNVNKGEIDAAMTWEPFVYKSQQGLGDNFLVLPEQESYYYHFILAGKKSWINANRDKATRVLRALIRAEKFAAKNPMKAQRIISERFRLDAAFVAKTWDKYVLEITLLQTLLSRMEQEARWLVDNQHVDAAKVPNFLQVIDDGLLREVSPDAVNMIR